MGCSKQQLCLPRVELQLLGLSVRAGKPLGWGGIKCSVAGIGRLWRSLREKRSAALPERDLGLWGESLGEVPVAQVSKGYPSSRQVHVCWDWKKPGRLRCLQGIPLSGGERMNGECPAGTRQTHFSPGLPKGQRAMSCLASSWIRALERRLLAREVSLWPFQ